MDEMTTKELARGCERAIEDARVTALKILSPIQVAALDSYGYRIVPDWIVRTFIGVLDKATDAALLPSEGGSK